MAEDLEELRRRFEEHLAQLDAESQTHLQKCDDAIAQLPPEFQERIKRLQQEDPLFRLRYEAYDLGICQQAVAVVNRLHTPAALNVWARLSHTDQLAFVPELEEHSGTSFNTVCAFAHVFMTNPEAILEMPSAYAPFVPH